MSQTLEELNNWSGIVGILAGLNSNPIFRLRKTKEVRKSRESCYESGNILIDK
jgi:hypothetical protein